MKNGQRILFFSFIFFIFSGVLVFGNSSIWHADVVKVADGDTLTVHVQNTDFREKDKKQRVRLYGIDCPEKKQEEGLAATDLTASYVMNKRIVIKELDIDRYDRVVGIVTLSDGSTLQEQLLRNGLAWVYPRYCKIQECVDWKKIQEEARKHKRGIWKIASPVPPWEWRKNNNQSKKSGKNHE